MKKVSYTILQQKYPGEIVALDRKEQRVITSGKRFSQIFRNLKKEHVKPQSCVFLGPIQKAGTINVYIISLRKKTN